VGSPELDETRGLATSRQDFLIRIQKKRNENTGITSLKIDLTGFGYFPGSHACAQKTRFPTGMDQKTDP